MNGQTVKTKIITKELKRQLGKKEVGILDSRGGMKKMPQLFFRVGQAMRISRNIIMLPAHNGVRFFAPVLVFWKRIYQAKIHYVVIGGWLPDLVEKNKSLAKSLKKFDGIYVETSTMKKHMEALGFSNIYILPNCKELKILKEEELHYTFAEPLRLCTFSRVLKEKGIEDAVNAVKEANSRLRRTAFCLDIYGQIDDKYEDEFTSLQKQFPEYVAYKGLVPFDRSVEILKDYYALLFPTNYYTEGIPGTIIDAYASGLPVISAKWESFNDLIDDGVVGKGYSFGDTEELTNLLVTIANNSDCLIKMKKNCLKEAEKYTVSKVITDFIGGVLQMK